MAILLMTTCLRVSPDPGQHRLMQLALKKQPRKGQPKSSLTGQHGAPLHRNLPVRLYLSLCTWMHSEIQPVKKAEKLSKQQQQVQQQKHHSHQLSLHRNLRLIFTRS